MELGQRIYNRMRNLGLTQVELAKKTGLTQQVISQYIRDRSRPGYNAIIGLMKGLEVESEWFFERADEEEPAPPAPAVGNASQARLTLKERLAQLEEQVEQLAGQINRDEGQEN